MDLIIQRGRRLLDPDHQLRQRPPWHHHPRHPLSQPQVTDSGDGYDLIIMLLLLLLLFVCLLAPRQARQHSRVQRSDGNFQPASSLCHSLCSSHWVGGQVIIFNMKIMMRISPLPMLFTLSGGDRWASWWWQVTLRKSWIFNMMRIMVSIMLSRGSGLPTLGSPTPKPTEGGSVRSGSVLAHYPGLHCH